MVIFCPNCHNLLLLKNTNIYKFFCKTCSYSYPIKNKISDKKNLDLKKSCEVFTDDNKLSGSKTQAICPACNFDEAYFFQIQIRSADEPMTTFFTCCQCNMKWKEG